MTAAVVVPSAPLLVPDLAGGSAAVDAVLRAVVLSEVRALATAPAARLVVVGAAPRTGRYEGTWNWTGFGVPLRGASSGDSLPLGPGIGGWLLDETGGVPRTYYGVREDEPPEACAALGAALVADGEVALLVVGDGSACRNAKAPGYFDPRAAVFDDAAVRAFRTAELASLLSLDPVIAVQLGAVGRAPWQVLAGAAGQRRWRTASLTVEDPYGVCYITGRWLPQDG